MALDRHVVEAWLDEGAASWDVGTRFDRWLAKGRAMGPAIVPMLRDMWYKPACADRMKALRGALVQLVIQPDADYYPYSLVHHETVRSAQQIAKLPASQRCIHLKIATAISSDRYKEAFARHPNCESIVCEATVPVTLDFLEPLSGIKHAEVTTSKARIDITALGSLSSLEFLRLRNARYVGIEALAALPRVRSFTVEAPGMAEQCVGNLRRLKYCNLVGGQESDLALLGNGGGLEALRIYSSKDLQTLKSLKDVLSSLTSLTVSACPNLSDCSILANAGALETLHLSRIPKVTSLEWIANLPNLRVLKIERCSHVKDVTPIGKLTQLRELQLNDMGKLPNLAFVRGMKELRHLDFVGSRIGDQSYEPLHHLSNLLTVHGWRLKAEQIDALRHAVPNVIFNGQESVACEQGIRAKK